VVQDFPDIELPTVTVTATLAGRGARPQLETEVARKIENSIATLQGVKNIYTKVLDGSGPGDSRVPPGEANPGGRGRRARRGAAGALPTCRPTCATPSVSKVNLSGAPILTYTQCALRQHGRRGA